MKEQQKPQHLKKNPSRRSPHSPFGYFVTFSPDRPHQQTTWARLAGGVVRDYGSG
jgi:hypothetical protein